MLDQNRAQRYILYAIGEILLVVIGILIALQISTWNKEKQNKTHEVATLVNLKEDLEIQKELIQEQIDHEQIQIAFVDSANHYIHSNSDKAVLSNLINQLNNRHTFKANRVTFNNMISGGGMNLISNDELQTHIIRYFQRLDYTESVVNNNNLHMIDRNFGNFVANNALGLEIDAEGNINPNTEFDGKQSYLVFSQLRYRLNASKSIDLLCNNMLELTDELIVEIDSTLN